MKLYELIIALHPSLSTEDTQDLVAKVEALFPAGIKNKDEIGYQTIYNVEWLKSWTKIFFISFLIEIDPTTFPEVKQKMSLMKGLVRSLFLARWAKEEFIEFAELNEAYSEKIQVLATKDKKAKKTKDQKQQLLDATKDVEIEIVEWSEVATEE